MRYYWKRFLGAVLCFFGRHQWTAVNDASIPGDQDPDRITDIHCARCLETYPTRWTLSESNGPKSYRFPRAVTEKHALEYLRKHYAGASVDLVDREWHVIFYRIQKQQVS